MGLRSRLIALGDLGLQLRNQLVPRRQLPWSWATCARRPATSAAGMSGHKHVHRKGPRKTGGGEQRA